MMILHFSVNCTAATRICRYDAINKDGRPTIVIPTNEEDWNLQDFCSSAMPSATGDFGISANWNGTSANDFKHGCFAKWRTPWMK